MASRVLDTDQRGKPQRDPPYRRMRQLGSRTHAPASPRTDASHWLALIGSREEMDRRLQHLFNCPRSTWNPPGCPLQRKMVFQDLSKIHACGLEGAVFRTPELVKSGSFMSEIAKNKPEFPKASHPNMGPIAGASEDPENGARISGRAAPCLVQKVKRKPRDSEF